MGFESQLMRQKMDFLDQCASLSPTKHLNTKTLFKIDT